MKGFVSTKYHKTYLYVMYMFYISILTLRLLCIFPCRSYKCIKIRINKK